ncbi:MAG: hypothetical protein ACTS40_01315 [Candidatus Hodgkinia cicadicola]
MHGWDCNPMVSGWKDGLCCVRNRGSDCMKPFQNKMERKFEGWK